MIKIKSIFKLPIIYTFHFYILIIISSTSRTAATRSNCLSPFSRRNSTILPSESSNSTITCCLDIARPSSPTPCSTPSFRAASSICAPITSSYPQTQTAAPRSPPRSSLAESNDTASHLFFQSQRE